MKEAKVRATTNLGTDLGHAVYGHWRESVVDYALFQCAFLTKIKTEEGYYQYLKEKVKLSLRRNLRTIKL